MSRRVTISVPDDVAEQLDVLPARQVSAYVTEALRRRRASDEMREALSAAGHPDYPYDPAGAVGRLATGRVGEPVRDATIAGLAASMGWPVADVRSRLDAVARGLDTVTGG
jgi:hypothetical protein